MLRLPLKKTIRIADLMYKRIKKITLTGGLKRL
jgi:hypothetical protein